jgi:hypothetical protein
MKYISKNKSRGMREMGNGAYMEEMRYAYKISIR